MPLWDTQTAISIDCLTLDSVHLTLKFGAHWFRTWFYDCWYFELQRKLATDTLYHAKLRAFFFSFEKRNEIFEWAVCVLHYESCGCTVYQSRSVCSMHECVQFEVKCMKRKKDGQSYRVETYTTNKSKFNSNFQSPNCSCLCMCIGQREAFVKSSMQNISRLFLHLAFNLNRKNGAA